MRCEPEYVGPSVALGSDSAGADGSLATLRSVTAAYLPVCGTQRVGQVATVS